MATSHDMVAVIPARGGSRRIPRKNIRPFLGVPLLARTIVTLRETALFSRIVVSTDDDEISGVALDAGAEVPFMREAALADDVTSTVPVIRDAVERLARAGATPAAICAVYPAAVFTTAEDLRTAAGLLRRPDTDFVVPVTSFPFPIQRAVRLDATGGMSLFQPEHYDTRSQDLEPAFHDAGQFYLGTREAWLRESPLFSARTRALRLPRHRVQDIDTLEDWVRAEQLFQLQQSADDAVLTSLHTDR